MRNIKLVLSYDGTEYSGWERQRDFRTLQQTLEAAVESLTGEAANVVASGRTDAGVHAIGQVANFRTNCRHDCETIRRALNALMPDDVRVLEAIEVNELFHATYAAKGKLYRYVMYDGLVMDPVLRRYALHCHWPMNATAMHAEARELMGSHDFSSFETAGAPRESSVRTITHVAVFRDGPERIWNRQSAISHQPSAISDSPLLFLEVSANGFLYNMVRAIAGTLIDVGRGYRPAGCISEILKACDRRRAGPTAPPHGLFLVRVDY